MTHIIVATHGKFSEEIVKFRRYGVCEDENCHVVTFLPGEGGEHLIEKYNSIIATLPEMNRCSFWSIYLVVAHTTRQAESPVKGIIPISLPALIYRCC